MKRTEPDRFWDDARAKVEQEGACRICKRTDLKLEAAHVLGRAYDEPRIGASGQPLKELYVDPDRIIPACGPFPENCHGDVDLKRIDLLPHLTIEEELRAVKDAGGIQAARTLLAPVEHREEVEASAYSGAA